MKPLFLLAEAAADTPAEDSLTADPSLAWEKMAAMTDGFFRLIPNMIIGLVVFVLLCFVGLFVQYLVERATRDRESSNIGTVLGRLARWTIILVGLMVAVSIVSPSVGPEEFLGALGISSIAIGFAFKDVLQNFLAGILILLREPFKLGDAIEVGGYSGSVQAIETRSTILKTWDGQQVFIPNGQIFTSPVKIITAYPQRRKSLVIGIGYGDDIRQAHKVILDSIKSVEGVLEDPAPFVLTQELAESSINLEAFWWTSAADFGTAGSEVITRIKENLDKAGIDMPYPTQVSLLHDQTDESDGDRTKQREGWPAGSNPPRPRPMLSVFSSGTGSQAADGNTTGPSNGHKVEETN